MNELNYDLLENMFEGAYVVNSERKIIFWNKASEAITGYTSEEVVDKFCFNNILRHVTKEGKELCFEGCPLHHTLKTGQINEANVFLHHKEGHRVPVTVKSLPIYDGEEIIASIEIFTDLNKQHRSVLKENRELKEQLITDPLTRIPNRRYLDFYLDHMMVEKEKFGLQFGVLFFDIDFFKNVNDTYGHNVGDEVLKLVSRTLKSNLRSDDKIGRWGGEEFIAVLRMNDINELYEIAEKLRILVSKSVYHLNATDSIEVTISIGGALIKKDETIELLIDRADKNMYSSKDSGRNRVTIK